MAKTRNEAKNGQAVETKSNSDLENINYKPFLILALFTIFMLTLPLSCYYLVASYVPDSTVLPALGAILMVQVIVGAYVYIAWREENREFQNDMNEEAKKKKKN